MNVNVVPSVIPDTHGFRFLWPAAGRSLGCLGDAPIPVMKDSSYSSAWYSEAVGSNFYSPAMGIGQAEYEIRKAEYVCRYRYLRSTMGVTIPALAPGETPPPVYLDARQALEVLMGCAGKTQAEAEAIVAGGLQATQAASQQQASAHTGQPNQSVPSADTSVPMPTGGGPSAAQELARTYTTPPAGGTLATVGGIRAGGISPYVWIGVAAVALLMVVKK